MEPIKCDNGMTHSGITAWNLLNSAEVLEPIRRQLGIARRVLGVAVAEAILEGLV
jgi:hypothetical protein